MPFDPSRIPDETCADGHLDGAPIYDVLMALHAAKATGRLTIDDGRGPNHMFFMQGRPVGVSLAEYVHPLGQLLLELGRANGATFVRAQRLIAEGNRLAGQVFKELGVLDDDTLRAVLATQARKKAEHFCRLGGRTFTFCRGLSYLMGFTSTSLDLWVVVFLAVRAQLDADSRAAWIGGLRDLQVRIKNAPGDEIGLPAPPSAFGFGAAEERFLQRIVGGWEKVSELCDTGTLPADEAAVLLRFLDVIGRLDKRQPPAVPAQVSAVMRQPQEVRSLAVPESLDEVFTSKGTVRPAMAAPAPVHPPLASPTPSLAGVFASPDDQTDPARPAVQASLQGAAPRLATREREMGPFADAPNTPPVPPPAPPPALAPAPPTPPPALSPDRPRFRSVLFPEPEQNAPPPPSLGDDVPAPIVKKKKVKRTEPLPSEGSGVLVSETRKEKTQVGPMPSIVIDDE